jgi:cytochrome P450
MHPMPNPNTLPGLTAIPLLGARGGLVRFFRDPIATLHALRDRGDVVALARGHDRLVAVFGANHHRTVLSDANLFHNFATPLFPVPDDAPLQRLMNALTSMNGEQHKRHRRLMMPAFTKSAIEGYHAAMTASCDRFLERWRPGTTKDVAAEMIELTLVAAMRSLFGLDLEDGAAEMGRLGMKVLEGLTDVRNILLPVDLPGTPYRTYMRVCETAERRMRDVIRRRRSATDKPRDVLSILIDAHDDDGTRFTDDDLVGHTNVLFIAGHETSAFTLSWTLLLLAQHPRVFDSLVDELDAALRGGAPSVGQLAQLPVLDSVVKESMRLLPPTPFLFIRQATDGFALGTYRFPRGTQIILSPYIAHRDPDLFPEPLRFRPERWRSVDPGPYEYMPFGAGPRLCLGAGFAAQLVRIALAMIVQRFRLRLVEGARIDRKIQGITLGPKPGIPMHLEPRERRVSRTSVLQGNVREMVAFD